MQRLYRSLFLIALTLPAMSVGASKCIHHLTAKVFPQFQTAAVGFRQSIPYQEEILLFGVGHGIFVWQEKDQLFVATKSGQLLGMELLPFEARSIVVLPNLAATVGDATGIPMHLIGVVGANRLVVYQFDPGVAFDLRIEALDFFEPGYYPQRVDADFASLPGAPADVPKFTVFGLEGRQTEFHLRGNRLKVSQ